MSTSQSTQLTQSNLGQTSEYPTRYNPELLFPITRQEGRQHLGYDIIPAWHGQDLWTAYEVSWLNKKGKPIVAIAYFSFSEQSTNLIESKSFKLYLNSFNQEKFENTQEVIQRMIDDLSRVANATVDVKILTSFKNTELSITQWPGECLDNLDIDVAEYAPNAKILRTQSSEVSKEILHTHLLKSNCPVTNQPDWGSVLIAYEGPKIDHEALLKYIISFRNENGFHEQCTEQIFCDLIHHCGCEKLLVYTRYTRRGGLDINPWRSNCQKLTQALIKHNSHYRLARQ